MSIRDQQILRIALPSILSNITVPLLGLVDVAIMGHLGSASYIGAIAIGGMAFNIIYWIFAFLRMGTSGLTAQALGKKDLHGVMHILIRSIVIGMALSVTLIVLQYPIRTGIYWIINPERELLHLATTYFNICIWGAPAVLGLYALTGWFIGMQNTRIPMFIAITQNIINIAASISFVFGWGMKVEGVALGTIIAQYAGFLMALICWRLYYYRLHTYTRKSDIWEKEELLRFFNVNRHIFFRTICLVSVMLYFTSAGTQQGESILAANTLLMEFYLLFSYVMDGFANAGEALSGKFIGGQNLSAFNETLHRLFFWSILTILGFTLFFWLGGNAFIRLLTNEVTVIQTASSYLIWVILVPVTGAMAFIFDGIYIGATATRDMLLSVFLSAILFFVLYFSTREHLGNHGLWLAYDSYLLFRGIVLLLRLPAMKRSKFEGLSQKT